MVVENPIDRIGAGIRIEFPCSLLLAVTPSSVRQTPFKEIANQCVGYCGSASPAPYERLGCVCEVRCPCQQRLRIEPFRSAEEDLTHQCLSQRRWLDR